MICLPYAGRDISFDTRMDIASLVSHSTSHLGRLTGKHHCNVSSLVALSARYDSTGSDASPPSSSAASIRCRNWSRNVGFSCGASSHVQSDDVLAEGSASQIEENANFSESEGSSEHHIAGLSSLEKKDRATKVTGCAESSVYDTKLSMDHSYGASSVGSNKSRLSPPSMCTTEKNQHIRNIPFRQISICGSEPILTNSLHAEPDRKFSGVTAELDNAVVPSIPLSGIMQVGLDPSLNSAHRHEHKSLIDVSHLQIREEDAKVQIKEDDHDSMGLKMYAAVENKGLENSHGSHLSSDHAEDVCALNFLKYPASAHGHSLPDYPALLKEMNQASKESGNDTDSMSVVRLPTYRTSSNAEWSSRLTESILYLDSLGVDSNRLIQEEPTIMTYDIKRLRELVRALEDLGLHWKDMGKVFNLCPRIIHLCPIKDIKLVTSFLCDEVGLFPKDLTKVIRRCPRLLACDVVDQLSPTLLFLRTLGFTNMGYVVANNAALLSMDVEKKLIPKLEYLESLGFMKREAVSMANRFPAIFNYNVKENLEPKYEYLVHQMGGSNRDLLAFPQYFGYSLTKRIIPRYQCMVKQDVSLSIQAMLKLSEAEFTARFQSISDIVIPSKEEVSRVGLSDCALESAKFARWKLPVKSSALVGTKRWWFYYV